MDAATAESGPLTGGLDARVYPQRAPADSRTSSTQSLVSSMDEGGRKQKRTLLIVYIHGFMGNNTSFRSFPAHVHNFLKDLLAETHVIHTKIYPRYKTYKSIDVARDNFSSWLAPHESHTTDVVLVGHSMGGLLSAEVVLMPTQPPNNTSYHFRHRILGTICLDAPLLGLHPGIVVSGIASLFRPTPSLPLADDTQTQTEGLEQLQYLSLNSGVCSDASTPSGALSPGLEPCVSGSSTSSPAPDPLYNPPFFNDVAFVDRGWFKNIVHFAKKHKEENLFHAAANHIASHLEFSGCLADYSGLRSRYSRLRELEDVDEWRRTGADEQLVRVRFVNYYTVSTGIPKKPKSPGPPDPSLEDNAVSEERSKLSLDAPQISAPRISIEDYSEESQRNSLQELEPMPEPIQPTSLAEHAEPMHTPDPHTDDDPTAQALQLPAIPPLPSPPTTPDLDSFPDKDSRKRAEKDFKLAQKDHEKALKARDKALKDRQKALDKHERKLLKEAAKLQKANAKPPPPCSSGDAQQLEKGDESKEQRPKLRTFCLLPSHTPSASRLFQPNKLKTNKDPTWIEVYMPDVDEVGAHCGLFVPEQPHYERLVGDVGERIAGWVREEESRRAIVEGMEGLDVGDRIDRRR